MLLLSELPLLHLIVPGEGVHAQVAPAVMVPMGAPVAGRRGYMSAAALPVLAYMVLVGHGGDGAVARHRSSPVPDGGGRRGQGRHLLETGGGGGGAGAGDVTTVVHDSVGRSSFSLQGGGWPLGNEISL